MILLYVLACAYPDFLGDTDPVDTDPVDTDPVDTDTDPVDTDAPTPCGEEPVPTSAIELDTNHGIALPQAFGVAAGGPGEVLVLRPQRVDRVAITRTSADPVGSFHDAALDAATAFGESGDLDGDGALDLLLWRSGAPCVVHLHAFTEAAPVSLSVGHSARACAVVADLTGDALADVVVADLLLGGTAPGVGVWDGAALLAGVDTPWATYHLEPLAFGSPAAVRVADLDGDGVKEVIVATDGEIVTQDAPAVAAVLPEQGAHTLGSGTVLLRSEGLGEQFEVSLALGDWDGDGDLDPAGAFWAAGEGPGAVLGHGEEEGVDFAGALFQWQDEIPTPIGRSAVGLGDFDGGGCDDLALTVPGDSAGRIAIYSGTSLRGDLAGVVPAVGITPASTFVFDRGLVAPGDLDGDGLGELVVLDTTGGVLTAHVFFGGTQD